MILPLNALLRVISAVVLIGLVAPAWSLNILVVNDDSCNAEGVNTLMGALETAGHTVTMFAPAGEQSGKSSSRSTRAFEKYGVSTIGFSGPTGAENRFCVRIADLDATGIYQGTLETAEGDVVLMTLVLARSGETTIAFETDDSERATIILWGESAGDTSGSISIIDEQVNIYLLTLSSPCLELKALVSSGDIETTTDILSLTDSRGDAGIDIYLFRI